MRMMLAARSVYMNGIHTTHAVLQTRRYAM